LTEITRAYITSDRLGDPDAWSVGHDNVTSIQLIHSGEWLRIHFQDGSDMTFNRRVVDSYQREETTQC
jgi:hypothetical protein